MTRATNPQSAVGWLSWRESIARSWRIALVCALLCLIVRSAVVYKVADSSLYGDMWQYDRLARSIISDHEFAIRGEPTSEKSPGYPLFVAVIYQLSGGSKATVLWAQVFLAAIYCAVLVVLAMRVTGRARTALLAGIAFAGYYPAALLDAWLYSETLFAITTLAAIVAIDTAVRSNRWWGYAITGILIGLATYVRPTAAVFPVVVFVLALLSGRRLKKSLLALGIVGLMAYLTLLPWAIRNDRVFGRFTPLPSYKGWVLYGSWYVYSTRSPDWALGPRMPADMKKLFYSGKKGYELDDMFWRAGVEEIKSQPKLYLKSAVLKTIRQWTNLFWKDPPSKASMVLALCNTVMLALTVSAFRRHSIDRLFRAYTLIFTLYITAVGAFMSHAETRYALWVIPLLLVLAADTVSLWRGTPEA